MKRQRFCICCPIVELLEDRLVPSTVSVNAGQVVRPVAAQLLGVNLTWWDTALTTSPTQPLVQAAGLNLFRFPGGSSADTWHFNAAPTYNGEGTSPSMASFIASMGGTGMVTLNYGTGSPQEAAAFLAYLNARVGDPTPIGVGPQWSDASNRWVNVDWKTAGTWAGLRAATPLAQDDGLNFLRLGRSAPFGTHYVEIGNEVFGSWETDHHATPHDPATYVAFARQFAAYAVQIDPTIAIGVDGSGTGGSYSQIPGNWTDQMLRQCAAQGFTPNFISDHNYMFDPGNENDATLLLHSATDPQATGYGGPINWAGRAAAYRNLLTSDLGAAGAGVQLLATEFNSVSSSPSNQSTSLVNGLWLADALGGLLQTEYNGATVWCLRGGYDTSHDNGSLYGWRTGGDYGLLGDPNGPAPATGAYLPYPTYFAEQLLSEMVHAGDTVVPTMSDDATLAAYAVKEQNGHLDLLVINKNPNTDLTEQFNLTGFTPAGQATVWQYGKAQDTAQSQTTDGHSSLAQTTQQLAVNGSSFNLLVPAYSMTILDLAPAPTVTQEPMPGNLASAANALTHSAEATSEFVTRAYNLYLKRTPDAGGLAYWLDQLQNRGLTDERLEANLLGSAEYIQNHGGTGQAWIVGMYMDLLGRAPDAGGVSYWTGVLDGGGHASAVALGFAASAEREGQRVAADYTIYLGRTLDSGGQTFWVNQFLGGARNEDIVAGFIASKEYYQQPAKGQSSHTAWIDSAFHDAFQRSPTTAELAYWLAQLQ